MNAHVYWGLNVVVVTQDSRGSSFHQMLLQLLFGHLLEYKIDPHVMLVSAGGIWLPEQWGKFCVTRVLCFIELGRYTRILIDRICKWENVRHGDSRFWFVFDSLALTAQTAVYFWEWALVKSFSRMTQIIMVSVIAIQRESK